MQLAFDGGGSLKPEGMALAGVASAKGGNAGMALALFGLGASPSAAQVPIDLRAEMAKTASIIDLTSISGEIAGEPVEGSAHFDMSGEQPRFNLAATAGTVSLPALLGSLVAWQRHAVDRNAAGLDQSERLRRLAGAWLCPRGARQCRRRDQDRSEHAQPRRAIPGSGRHADRQCERAVGSRSPICRGVCSAAPSLPQARLSPRAPAPS